MTEETLPVPVDPLQSAGEARLADAIPRMRIAQELRRARHYVTAAEFRKQYVDQFGRQLLEPGVDVHAFYDWAQRSKPDVDSRAAVAQFILDLVADPKKAKPGVPVTELCTMRDEVRVAEVTPGLYVMYAFERLLNDIVVLEIWRRSPE